MPMNVGELLKERERLLGVLEEAKSARHKLKQVNILIAMYGDADNISQLYEELYCGKCDAGPFKGQHGIEMHNRLKHGGKPKVAA